MLEARRNGYTLSDDRTRLDVTTIHEFLTTSYWATGISREQVDRSIRHSDPFAIYHDGTGAQVGFARVITDRTTYGYLSDVFVLDPHRGQGLARWMVAEILAHPEFPGLRRWMLATRNAHAVYASVGFTPVLRPERFMELVPAGGAP